MFIIFVLKILIYLLFLEKEGKKRLSWPELAHHPFIQVELVAVGVRLT
jgi:hypothetical protein